MKISELSESQLKVLLDSTDIVRGYCRQIVRVALQIKIASSGSGVQEFVAILQSLDDGESVPNRTGLSGARALSKAQLLSLMEFAHSLGLLVTDSMMAIFVDAVGPDNVLDR